MRQLPLQTLGHEGRKRREKQAKEETIVERVFETTFSHFTATCHYPDENPPDAVETITKALTYLGVFDDINNK